MRLNSRPRWRLFPIYPGGFPAAGRLLLRGTLGLAAMGQGWSYILNGESARPANWLIGVAMILDGIALAAGLLTVPAAGAAAIAWCATALGRCSPTALFGPDPATALLAIIAIAIVLLGPGALSVDAWLFGFRRIVIPRSARPPVSPNEPFS